MVQTTLEMDFLLFQSFVNVTVVISSFFVFCQNGNIVSSECETTADVAYSSLWYRYPRDLQPYMTIILARTQKLYVFTGYKMTKCNFESFKKVSGMRNGFEIRCGNSMGLLLINRLINIFLQKAD